MEVSSPVRRAEPAVCREPLARTGYVKCLCCDADTAALRCAGGGAVEQVEDDLLVAVLIQVEGNLLGGLILLGHADGDLLGAVARGAYADRDLLPGGNVAEIEDNLCPTGRCGRTGGGGLRISAV